MSARVCLVCVCVCACVCACVCVCVLMKFKNFMFMECCIGKAMEDLVSFRSKFSTNLHAVCGKYDG